MSEWPDSLQVNAWSGRGGNRSSTSPRLGRSLFATPLPLRDVRMLAPPPVDPRDWRDPRVGWGIVLADNPALDEAALARGEDAPATLRALLAQRSGVVLRYRPDRGPGMMRRYYDDGAPHQDVLALAQNFGTARGRVPRYLLIYGSPAEIPWSVQFELQQSCFTGRLDIDGAALDRYIECLKNDWVGSHSRPTSSLIWAVDHDTADITHLMRNAIAKPLDDAIGADPDPDLRSNKLFIDGLTQDASIDVLVSSLANRLPRFIATTSHGATGPLNDTNRMRADLGLLVGSGHEKLDLEKLSAAWSPGGAVWYAHACCSAGSVAESEFSSLVSPGTDVDEILRGVARCGETMSPLPRALLSAEKPLRAFIGHIEPTFDWSVRHPLTGQYLTRPLLDFLYQRLFSGEPVGMALDSCRRIASDLMNVGFRSARHDLAAGGGSPGDALAIRLMASDWRGIVLLGDPTVKAFP